MTFRTKLFLIFTLALVLSVGLVAAGVTEVTRRAFDQMNEQHTDALVAQFQREVAQRSEDVVHRVQGIADAEATVRMAIDLSRPKGDVSVYVNDAAAWPSLISWIFSISSATTARLFRRRNGRRGSATRLTG